MRERRSRTQMGPQRFTSGVVALACVATSDPSQTEARAARTAAHPGGCCFTIGFGSLMRPCCLEVQHVEPGSVAARCTEMARSTGGGGAAGNSAHGCPADAEQAAEWIRDRGEHSQHASFPNASSPQLMMSPVITKGVDDLFFNETTRDRSQSGVFLLNVSALSTGMRIVPEEMALSHNDSLVNSATLSWSLPAASAHNTSRKLSAGNRFAHDATILYGASTNLTVLNETSEVTSVVGGPFANGDIGNGCSNSSGNSSCDGNIEGANRIDNDRGIASTNTNDTNSSTESCLAYTCPRHMVPRAHASNFSCTRQTCSDADTGLCCIEATSCKGYACPNGSVPVSGLSEAYCSGPACVAADEGVCCRHVVTCATYSCEEGWARRENASQIACMASRCSEEDGSACCEELGRCEDFECPPGSVPTANSSNTSCSASICTDSSDTRTCCDRAASCSGFVCPTDFFLKSDANRKTCASARCEASSYRLCCDEAANCSSNSCPSKFVLRNNSDEILCNGASCGERDSSACCEKCANCASFNCPTGTVPKTRAWDAFCAGRTCTAADSASCCDALASCDGHVCPAKLAHRPDVSRLFCGSTSCTSADDGSCCSEAGCCYSFGLRVEEGEPCCLRADENSSRAACGAEVPLGRFQGFASRCPVSAQEALEWLVGDSADAGVPLMRFLWSMKSTLLGATLLALCACACRLQTDGALADGAEEGGQSQALIASDREA